MIFDVTVAITNDIPVWPGDRPVKRTAKSHPSRDGSHPVEVTSIEMGSHTGTHIDAPFHMVSGGRRLSDIPIGQLVGKAVVAEIPGVRSIGRPQLEKFEWN